MKLSDIKGDKTLDVLADLIMPVSNIAMDKETAELFSGKPLKQGQSRSEAAVERLRAFAPRLIKSHKEDVIDILATISMTDRDEYEESMNLGMLTRDLLELINDKEFVSFFTSAVTEAESTDG